jgi:hypothetical protein
MKDIMYKNGSLSEKSSPDSRCLNWINDERLLIVDPQVEQACVAQALQAGALWAIDRPSE